MSTLPPETAIQTSAISQSVMDAADKNIRWYKIHQTFSEPFFWGPIILVSHQKLAGMSTSDFYLVEACAVATVVLLDIRMGIWADKIGHRRVMIAGEILLLISFICFALMSSPWHAWAANLIWGIGFACSHGADHSYLHENLKASGREDDHAHQNISSAQHRFLLMAGSCLITGYLAEINMRLPLLLSIPLLFVSMFALSKLKEPRVYAEGSGDEDSGAKDTDDAMPINPLTSREVFKEAWGTIRANGLMVWAAAFFIITSVGSKVYFFTYNDYFNLVGLPIWVFGWIFCLINLASFAIARYPKIFLPKGKGMGTGLLVTASLGLISLVQGVWPIAIFAFLPVFQVFSRCLVSPIMNQIIHQGSKSTSRATAQSVVASIKDIVSVLGLLLYSWASKSMRVDKTLILLGITIMAGLAVLMWMSARIKRARHMSPK